MKCLFFHRITGELTAEGGSPTSPVGVACSSILKPQPIPCSALASSLCHRALDQSCSFQARFQPQMCCSHCVNVAMGPATHPDLLMGSSRGAPGDLHGVRCHSVAGSYPDRTLQHSQLQPETRPVAELDRKQAEPSACPVAHTQSSPPHAPPQGRCDPPTPPPLIAHPPQCPQQPAPAQTPSAGRPDDRLRSPCSSPPKEPQPAQSSLQLLLQSPHQLQTERLPSRPAADPAQTAAGQSSADADADASFQRGGEAKVGAWSRVGPGQRTGEPSCTPLQPQAPPAPEHQADRPSAQPSTPLQRAGDCTVRPRGHLHLSVLLAFFFFFSSHEATSRLTTELTGPRAHRGLQSQRGERCLTTSLAPRASAAHALHYSSCRPLLYAVRLCENLASAHCAFCNNPLML